MPKIAYDPKVANRMKPETLSVIDQANTIITEYESQGFVLTLRQLYYQFVSRGLIPNTLRDYKRLGDILNKGRLGGLVDWSAMEDRTRRLQEQSHWTSPRDIIEAARQSYHIDMWANQPSRVVVRIEKDALLGVVEGVCERNDVPFIACRGYSSQSEQWRMGQKIQAWQRKGRQRTIILYLGDHDPSGIDMTRDNQERLSMFSRWNVEVRRLALNLDQVDEYDPPPNPTKDTDSRSGVELSDGSYPPGTYRDMMQQEGRDVDTCWELDALSPTVIANLIQDAVDEIRDPDLWEAREEELRADQAALDALLEGL